MKFLVSLNSVELCLNAKQLERFIDIVDGCEVKSSDYVGTGKGIDGSSYIDKINHRPVKDMLRLQLLSDVEYEALVTRSALQNAE